MRKLLLIPLLVLASVLAFAPPALAAEVVGPLRSTCRVNGKLVLFWTYAYYPTSDYKSFTVHRVAWSTQPSFKPSRVVISVKKSNGKGEVVRIWGGAATSLRDVGATGDTGAPWGTKRYSTSAYVGIFARFYLNGSKSCVTPVINVQ
ncbi:hypothetical protein OWR29_47195 [Actinoplanes sp. Pm04-4]|uniref:Uncharacterized protein n=1 Tax=Paractinoplanes pyxinae TaxID=2997416 RepID=A0ABT4BGM6_9ACTN|nr:hypothetical protein [Actinoplanes pyxinae]MCY1145637.1 hypothetical protein [Actinoplanes pyxinae]